MRLTGSSTPASAPIEIQFDGRKLRTYEGETVAAALAAHDIVALRTTTAQTQRGLWCGMGACQECLVTIDGRPNERACMTKVRADMVIESAPPQELMRATAIAPTPAAATLPVRECDLLIVGAGPAGLAAAIAAGRLALTVTILDERPAPGGQYYKPLAPSQRVSAAARLDAQFRAGAALEREARSIGVVIESNATVWGAFGPNEIGALVGDAAALYRPKRLLLATGAYERPVPIPGWTLPGVMTTGALQTLVRAYRVCPGEDVIVAGNGPLNLQLAAELVAGGVHVAAVVESASSPWHDRWVDGFELGVAAPDLLRDGLSYLLRLRRAGVPILWRAVATAAHGESRFKKVTIAQLDASGARIPRSERMIDADVLALGYGFIPSTELARALGCRVRYEDRHVGYYAVDTSEEGRTSVLGVYAVGDGADMGGARIAQARGTLAGLAIAEELGRSMARAGSTRAYEALRRARNFQRALARVFDGPRFDVQALADDTVICRCEAVTAGAVRHVLRNGFAHIGAIKRQTRCGMGRCQGRYCAPIVARMIEQASGQAPDANAWFAPRVPVKPVPVAALAFEQPEWGGHEEVAPPAPMPNANAAPRAPLTPRRAKADVAVIGGGVVGTCCAYYLAKAGVDTVLLERDELNMQASGANAGSLHVQLLSFDFGAKAQAGGVPAAETLPLGPASVQLWHELEKASGESFEIRTPGGLMVAENDAQMRFLEAKIKLEEGFGIRARLLDRNELQRLVPALSPDLVGAEFCPTEGKINPLRATYVVAGMAHKLNARVVRGVEVTSIERDSMGYFLRTSRGTVHCRMIVNAAGPWAANIARMVGLRDLPVRGAPLQMIVTEPGPRTLSYLVAHADRHLSLKQAETGGFIIGGGWTADVDAASGFARARRASIEGNLWVATRVMPALDRLRMVRAWAGMNVNIDGAPILGEAPGMPGFYNCVTANGYTLAPIVANITAELMQHGRSSVPISPYALERFAMA